MVNMLSLSLNDVLKSIQAIHKDKVVICHISEEIYGDPDVTFLVFDTIQDLYDRIEKYTTRKLKWTWTTDRGNFDDCLFVLEEIYLSASSYDGKYQEKYVMSNLETWNRVVSYIKENDIEEPTREEVKGMDRAMRSIVLNHEVHKKREKEEKKKVKEVDNNKKMKKVKGLPDLKLVMESML